MCPEIETNGSVLIKAFKLRKTAVESEPFLYFRGFVNGKETVDLFICFQFLKICDQLMAVVT